MIKYIKKNIKKSINAIKPLKKLIKLQAINR